MSASVTDRQEAEDEEGSCRSGDSRVMAIPADDSSEAENQQTEEADSSEEETPEEEQPRKKNLQSRRL